MARIHDLGITAVVTIGLLAPVAAGAVLALRVASQSPLESASAIRPLIGAVESAQRRQETQVTIAVEYADALSPATNASGTFTTVAFAPGTEIATGSVVGEVDYQDLVAYASVAPLYRDITPGSKGEDVRTAQQLLASLGFYASAPEAVVGRATEHAILAFNKAHGYGEKNPVLSLASLVWVGTGAVTVAKPSVALGDTVAPGTKLFTTTASLAAITVTEAPNVPHNAAVELTVAGVSTEYEPGSGRVTEPKAVAAIVASLGTATQGIGTLRLVDPLTVGTVPASAVVTDEQGRTCVFADVTGGPIPVEPRGGNLGTVDLDPALTGQPVLINPREVRKDLACG